jgi:hypothetical protein
MKKRSIQERFEEKFRKTDGCWIWESATMSKNGRGMFAVRTGECIPAYRYSYQLYVGDIPPNTEVHHKCKVAACVNPDHLIALTASEHGSQQENTTLV